MIKHLAQLQNQKINIMRLVEGDIYEVKIKDNKLDKVKIDFTFSKNLHDEFVQMFYENWAALAENFYDENYHGLNWVATKTSV
jgi:tricorn protease